MNIGQSKFDYLLDPTFLDKRCFNDGQILLRGRQLFLLKSDFLY